MQLEKAVNDHNEFVNQIQEVNDLFFQEMTASMTHLFSITDVESAEPLAQLHISILKLCRGLSKLTTYER